MNQQGSGTVGQTSNQLELFLGYFVDREGYLDFPVLGRIQVGGLTLAEAKQKILTLLLPQLTDAVINMRFLNFKITLTGEVNRPGIIRLSNQRVTILEALGHGGDFTAYANRTNVLLIREKDGQRTYTRIDLTKGDLFTSPYFYVQQNDVLYVEPIQAKVATVADPFSRAISYSSGLLAIITLIITLTR
jgi:polysaccharide export outer membrane protein